MKFIIRNIDTKPRLGYSIGLESIQERKKIEGENFQFIRLNLQPAADGFKLESDEGEHHDQPGLVSVYVMCYHHLL